MPETSPVGSQVIAMHCRSLSWAIDEIIQTLPGDAIRNLKVSSGEHLAAILLTAFFGVAPIGIDFKGGVDLTFNLHNSGARESTFLPMEDKHFIDFEVKSLPGQARAVNSTIQKTEATGGDASGLVIRNRFMSANSVLGGPARSKLNQARQQLDRKSPNGHSRNVFLISHFFDYPIVEIVESPIIAHRLTAPEDASEIDSLWVMWSPTCITVWSTPTSAWASLVFAQGENEIVSGDEDLEVLQGAEIEFLEKTGSSRMSPYVYGLSFGDTNRTRH